MEKGGHNPLVVLADADLDRAAAAVVDGAFGGTGQKCTSTAKVLVEASVADELTSLVLRRTSEIVTGPPDAPETTMGPLVSAQARDSVRAAIERAVAGGAEVAAGGGIPAGDAFAHGYYLQPTVLTGVTPDMPIATEEVFGPTVAIVPVQSREQALTLATGTGYGLSAGIYTASLAWARRFTATVRAGMLNVTCPPPASNPTPRSAVSRIPGADRVSWGPKRSRSTPNSPLWSSIPEWRREAWISGCATACTSLPAGHRGSVTRPCGRC